MPVSAHPDAVERPKALDFWGFYRAKVGGKWEPVFPISVKHSPMAGFIIYEFCRFPVRSRNAGVRSPNRPVGSFLPYTPDRCR